MLDLNDKTKLGGNPQRSILSITSPAKLNIISSSSLSSSNGASAIDWKKHKARVGKSTSLPRSKSLNVGRRSSLQVNSAAPGGSETTNLGGKISSSSFNRPKLSLTQPPLLLKRNSSFFKDDSLSNRMTSFTGGSVSGANDNNALSALTLGKPLTGSHDLEEACSVKTDRYIPLYQGNLQNKIDPEAVKEELPPPNASPKAHLQAQTKTVFKQNVAEACGLNMNQRILQYLPQPPVASFKRQTYQLKQRNQYNYSQGPRDIMKLRKINTNPERILDAPGFRDDFYLNLLSWSQNNMIAIGLDTAVYIWDASTGDVSLLVDSPNSLISSIVWSDDSCHVSIGKDDGNTEIWDIETMSLIRTMRSGLGVRIGSQSWLDTLVAAGSRSGEIQINDVRVKNHIVSTWDQHEGEVCGLSYKPDGLQLASGGNDNTVMLWDTRTSMPQYVQRNHNAAVKALSWCPYMPNVLASGGGQNDKHIHFWNSTTGGRLGSINTGSQVSSLHWGQSYNGNGSMNREIVATGGNTENAVSVFNFDTKFKVAEIAKAHESRICTSQLSPDGTTVATVGGDENLKFYKVFEPRRQVKRRQKSGGLVEDVVSIFGTSSALTLESQFDSHHTNPNNPTTDSRNKDSPNKTTSSNSYLIR
ncbi:ubiquitin-protein transferase activating protein CDC20 KNAG_0F02420 [Huiozyma naganishii CBS 8797]|uniref:CDC20/Fizzy WD40 domain-containing protein n=1 Tax=Huiozyma naganishii (strain ATCC MYA-139 / BCRC 22969 / CBS 8797 / KCTC 17520 / NBRC 10181 / NCYC 3082 / Yp74L-3) TaxID=1071383 RepID=J7S058_HUIN7|nr:hypothetical protein KNAG_0F02420 [Kazachstania naganishii CBS 8797]CCK70907.1 hypothetical protein KNAG_0F02420 [Kazachstania naganishii CBS 8797]